MLLNYFKTALRQMTNSPLYSAINICGLAIGLACCLLIMLYVRHELGFESGFTNADRIYRVSRDWLPREGARLRIPAQNNGPVGAALLAEYPQYVEAAARVYGGDTQLVSDTLSGKESAVRYADQSIFQMFNFQWLAGNADTALTEPNTVVLTETVARKYFGTVDAVGLALKAAGSFDLKVTGVIRDLPDNTHLEVSGLISMPTIIKVYGDRFNAQWNFLTDFHTYVMLRSGASIEPVMQQNPAFIVRHHGENADKITAMRAMNIRDIHLHSNRDEEWQPHGSISRVYSFATIAFSILLIACINFMSIATARSSMRAREVGMRKALGSTQPQLILQFLCEAVMFALISIGLAVALVEISLPAFSAFAGMELQFSLTESNNYAGSVVALAVFVALFAGSYPAFYLAGFKAARVLKGELDRGRKSLHFRNVLVVLQFAIAIVLLVSTAVVYKQRTLADSMDLGFNKDQIIVAPSGAAAGYRQEWSAFKQEMLSNDAVEQVTISHFLPFGFNDNQIEVAREGGAAATRIQYMLVDADFFKAYRIKLLAGRDFSLEQNANTDTPTPGSAAFIVNAAAARALNMNINDSIDTDLSMKDQQVGAITGKVVGVVADTLFESIRSAKRPLIFMLAPPQMKQRIVEMQNFQNAAIRVRANALPAALAHIDATWHKFYPNERLSRRFLNDDFQAQYQAEAKQAQLFAGFSLLAVLIACFGLFGLATFNAQRRTKEIGVRKVMGGGVWSIVLLLTNDFSRLVLLSNVIAWPLAYFLMNRWLQNFAYRIDLGPVVFIGSGLIALCIAWVTVGGTAAKAASQRPILALRYE